MTINPIIRAATLMAALALHESTCAGETPAQIEERHRLVSEILALDKKTSECAAGDTPPVQRYALARLWDKYWERARALLGTQQQLSSEDHTRSGGFLLEQLP